MGAPLSMRFADGSERCTTCKGFGLVKGEYPGGTPGARYKTLNGAQTALAAGRAVDCPTCAGCGLVNAEGLALVG